MYEFAMRQMGNEPELKITGHSVGHILQSRFFKLWTYDGKMDIHIYCNRVYAKIIDSKNDDVIVIGTIVYNPTDSEIESMCKDAASTMIYKAISSKPFALARLEWRDGKCYCVSKSESRTWFTVPALDKDNRVSYKNITICLEI